jgi:hypothetical protein
MTTRSKWLLIAFVLLLAVCFGPSTSAQNINPNDTTYFWETRINGVPSNQIVPTVSTLCSPAPRSPLTYVRINQLNLGNTSTSSTVTVTLVGNSTNCNGASCQPLPTITLQPLQKVTVTFNGEPVVGGVYWSASVANVVHGWAKGTF